MESPYSVNTVAIVAASKAIEDTDYVKWYMDEVKKARKVMYEGLQKLKLKYYPSEANFILVKLGKGCKETEAKLKEKGILVRDRSDYPLLSGCVRVGIGTVKQTQQFLQALKEILNE